MDCEPNPRDPHGRRRKDRPWQGLFNGYKLTAAYSHSYDPLTIAECHRDQPAATANLPVRHRENAWPRIPYPGAGCSDGTHAGSVSGRTGSHRRSCPSCVEPDISISCAVRCLYSMLSIATCLPVETYRLWSRLESCTDQSSSRRA